MTSRLAANSGFGQPRLGWRHQLLLIAVLTLAALLVNAAVASACSSPSIKRSTVQTRAGYGNGYSYWWGHGRWDDSVNTSDGSCCYGPCADCEHYASKTRNSRCSDEAGVVERGSDCSGYVSTAWMVNTTCGNFWITSGGHPYSTKDFRYNSQHWYTFTNLASLKNMDAAVRYDSEAHHIVLFNQRDSYGTPLVYEAKGCSAGIIYGSRTLDSNWTGVRRDNIIDG